MAAVVRAGDSRTATAGAPDVTELTRRIDDLERRLEEMAAAGGGKAADHGRPARLDPDSGRGEAATGFEAQRLYDMAVLNFRRGNPLAARELFATIVARVPDSPLASKAREYLTLLQRNEARGGDWRGERRRHWREHDEPYTPAETEELPGRAAQPASTGARVQRQPAALTQPADPEQPLDRKPLEARAQPELAPAKLPGPRQPVEVPSAHQNLQRAAVEDFKASVGDRVFFSEGSADLGSRGFAVIDGQANWLLQHMDVAVTVEGHADEAGTLAEQMAVSLRRAETVRQRLLFKGVAATRIRILGFGRDRRVTTCDDAACKAQNRRVITSVSLPGPGQANSPAQREIEAAELAEAAFNAGRGSVGPQSAGAEPAQPRAADAPPVRAVR